MKTTRQDERFTDRAVEEALMPEDAVPAQAQLCLRADDLKWTTTDDGVTVLDLRTARYLQLNRSGALLWERLSVGAPLDELIEALVQRFGIDGDRARHDATEFVTTLRERGFLSGA